MAQRDKKHTNAVVLLMGDHQAVDELFEKYETTDGKAAKGAVARQICLELSIHTTIEEELLYPICRGGAVDDALLDEAYVEHDGAKMLIAELLAGTPDDNFYHAKVKVLSEMIKHHVIEEERPKGLFAQVKASGIDLETLGGRMMARKEALKRDYTRNGIPAPRLRSVAPHRGKPIASKASALIRAS